MPETHPTAAENQTYQAERDAACAEFQRECSDLMGEVKVPTETTRLSLSAEGQKWARENFTDLKPESAMLAACDRFEQEEHKFDDGPVTF